MEKLREWIENGEEWVKVLIGGYFNVREGKGESGRGKGRRGGKRRSSDGKINWEGRKLCSFFLEELRWSILNGNVED